MTDHQQDEAAEHAGGKQYQAGDAWQEVGRQFQILGESLAAALRASLGNENNRQRFQAMQGDLRAMVNEIDRAMSEAARSPAAQEAKEEAQRAAESLRTAGEQTVQELRPHLLSALKELNAELHRVTSKMADDRPPAPPRSADDTERP